MNYRPPRIFLFWPIGLTIIFWPIDLKIIFWPIDLEIIFMPIDLKIIFWPNDKALSVCAHRPLEREREREREREIEIFTGQEATRTVVVAGKRPKVRVPSLGCLA